MSHPPIDLFVMAAMGDELSTLKSRSSLVATIPSPKGSLQIRRMKNGKHICSAICGILAPKAEDMLATMVKRAKMKELLIVGCCGGVASDMRFNQAVISQKLINMQNGMSYNTDDEMNDKITSILPEAISGNIACSDVVLENVDQKADCFSKTSALAVEMEGSAIAEEALKLEVKISSVRWVLDGEDENVSGSALDRALKNRLSNMELMARMRKISDNIDAFVEKLTEMM